MVPLSDALLSPGCSQPSCSLLPCAWGGCGALAVSLPGCPCVSPSSPPAELPLLPLPPAGTAGPGRCQQPRRRALRGWLPPVSPPAAAAAGPAEPPSPPRRGAGRPQLAPGAPPPRAVVCKERSRARQREFFRCPQRISALELSSRLHFFSAEQQICFKFGSRQRRAGGRNFPGIALHFPLKGLCFGAWD